jgi:hypothetical protein
VACCAAKPARAAANAQRVQLEQHLEEQADVHRDLIVPGPAGVQLFAGHPCLRVSQSSTAVRVLVHQVDGEFAVLDGAEAPRRAVAGADVRAESSREPEPSTCPRPP